jgi:hypothetical protein
MSYVIENRHAAFFAITVEPFSSLRFIPLKEEIAAIIFSAGIPSSLAIAKQPVIFSVGMHREGEK